MLFTELPLKKSKHIPYSNKLPSQFVTNTPYVSPLPTKSKTLWGPRNKEYSRTLSQHNKNEEHSKEHSSFFGTLEGTRTPDLLVRSQSLYPAELPAHLCVARFCA